MKRIRVEFDFINCILIPYNISQPTSFTFAYCVKNVQINSASPYDSIVTCCCTVQEDTSTVNKCLLYKEIFKQRRKNQTIFKMACSYKVCIVKDEFENANCFVSIKPNLEEFDSLKEAIYDRFTMLKNQPLHIYYQGQ